MYGLGQLGQLGRGVPDLPLGGRDYGHVRRGRRGYDAYALILGMRLVHYISHLGRKPPLTLALMAGMSVLHLKPELFEGLFTAGGFDYVRSVCLYPAFMFDTFERTGGLELRRLLISPFVHATDVHLYYNMASFLLKGVSLELTMGTHAFAGLLAYSLLASQLMIVLAAWVLLAGCGMPSPMQSCTVGFSGVLFALKYVLSRRSPETQTILGFTFNTRYATWIELGLVYLLVPNASFLGHLCGIMAGIFYVEVPSVVFLVEHVTGVHLVRRLRERSHTNGRGSSSRGPSYTYSSGTTSGRSSDRKSGTEPPRQKEQPETSSVYDAVSNLDAEEAAVPYYGVPCDTPLKATAVQGDSTSVGSNGGSAGEPVTAATESLGAAPRLPTAPPSEIPQQEAIAGEGQGGMASTAAIAVACQNRRFQRSGGVDDHVVL